MWLLRSGRKLPGLLLLLLVASLLRLRGGMARIADTPNSPSACQVRDSLRANNLSRAETDHEISAVVRLYWWFRFQGARRATNVKTLRDEITCVDHGLHCILDSTDEAFSSAHAVIVWVGARPDRERRSLPWVLAK